MPVLLVSINRGQVGWSDRDAGRDATGLHGGDDACHLLRRERDGFNRGHGLSGHGDGGQRGGSFRVLGAEVQGEGKEYKDGVFHISVKLEEYIGK